MLKCLRLNHQQSSKVFQSCRFNTLCCHTNRTESHTFRSRTASNLGVSSCCVAKCSIQTVSRSTDFAPSLAQERTKYESNALPKNARVVICGGGVMGGKFYSVLFRSVCVKKIDLHENCSRSKNRAQSIHIFSGTTFLNFKFIYCVFSVFFANKPAAVAYHLAQKGLGNDVVLLEQDRFVFLLCFFTPPYNFFDFIDDAFKFLQNWRRYDMAFKWFSWCI